MIELTLLSPVLEKTNYGTGERLSFCFKRVDSGGGAGGHEEMLDYRDCLSITSGEHPSSVILKLRNLAKRIECAMESNQ